MPAKKIPNSELLASLKRRVIKPVVVVIDDLDTVRVDPDAPGSLYRRGGGVYFAGPASRRPRSSTPWGSVRTEDFRLKTDWSDSTGTWPAGTTGTVVSDYGDHKEVEIVDADNYGATLDMPVVPVEQLKLIEKHS